MGPFFISLPFKLTASVLPFAGAASHVLAPSLHVEFRKDPLSIKLLSDRITTGVKFTGYNLSDPGGGEASMSKTLPFANCTEREPTVCDGISRLEAYDLPT